MISWVIVSLEVQQLFQRLQSGDSSALAELTPTLYAELHRIASRHLRNERPNHTLQPTALIHEAYLKLFDTEDERKFANPVHFLAVASRVMRQVLVDYARARTTLKRTNPVKDDGGAPRSTSLELRSDESGLELHELIELDSALQALAEEDEALAKVIEMRYFGGMTAEETAEALGVSVHVVRHDQRLAQAWLRRKLAR